MQSWHMEAIIFLHFFEVDATLGFICQILVLFFEMDIVVYDSFVVKTLSIVNTLFSNLLNLISLRGQ